MSKKNIISLTLIGIAMAASASAFAADNTPGAYVGGAIGQSKADGACDGAAGFGASCDDSDTGVKVFGGYQFNRNLAVEGAYTNFGKAELSTGSFNASLKGNAFSVAGVGLVPLANDFSLFGKLGLYNAEAKFSDSVGRSEKERNTGLMFGVGVKWDMANNLALRAEFERFNDVGDSATRFIGEGDVDLLSVGLSFKF